MKQNISQSLRQKEGKQFKTVFFECEKVFI